MDPQNSPYRYVIAGLAFLLNACFGLSFFVIGPVAPYIIDDYQISHSEAGLLTGITILAQTILAIPGSMLVGRIPVKALIAVGWFLAAAPGTHLSCLRLLRASRYTDRLRRLLRHPPSRPWDPCSCTGSDLASFPW